MSDASAGKSGVTKEMADKILKEAEENDGALRHPLV
jgi:hypothetical protein